MVKARCQGGSPCTECSSKGKLCIFNDPVHPEHAQPDLEEEAWEDGSGDDGMNTSDQINTSIGKIAQVDHYVHLYFTHFHQHWPVLHRHTFSVADEPQLLLHAVIMIGLWVSGSPAAQEDARNLHSKLKLAILAQQVRSSKTPFRSIY
ncbi:Transcription factor, fungi [Penicillium italicum]|uniref:Transcription factor, fungi n=1 Tax=Penicillium italicum TaxID=40296 RepID=A0A0A2KI67_PENIT|nr:Transcription factor, fungi [Penicillium italicum]